MSLPILTLSALRALEARHAHLPLMERAGSAAAQLVQERLPTGRVLIIAGPGNNGGDAFVLARLLRLSGRGVEVVFAGQADRLPADARSAHAAWRAAGGEERTSWPEGEYALAVDGLFGIGLSRPVTGETAALIDRFNALSCPRWALDCPSGLDSETGSVRGTAVRADLTLTFIALKPGLLTLDGPDHCGELLLADLGIEATGEAGGWIDAPTLFCDWLQRRRRNSHKGSFGSVAVIGGAAGMSGAALLCGRAALHLGAGRVYVGLLAPLPVDVHQPELMLRTPQEAVEAASVLAVGPGLGKSAEAAVLVGLTLRSPLPLLLDADALNLIAADASLATACKARTAPTVLTPHPAEAARLLAVTTAEIQRDRLTAARALSETFRCPVVLKGCGSIIAAPDGFWAIEAAGNAGLATAGSGDVLSGFIAALLAQGWPARAALLAGVHLHARAADLCVAEGRGPVGLTAGESIPAARRLLNAWIERRQEASAHAAVPLIRYTAPSTRSNARTNGGLGEERA